MTQPIVPDSADGVGTTMKTLLSNLLPPTSRQTREKITHSKVQKHGQKSKILHVSNV